MTPAAALRRRLVTVSVCLVAVLAVGVDAILYVRVRSELLASLQDQAVTRAAVDASLRRLLAVEALVTLLAVGLATALFGRVAATMLRPLETMLEVVRGQAAGRSGNRIRPQPEFLIGDLGQAYDQMLDGQDQAMAKTQAARDRSHRFLADAAHQIRTPIAGIQACAETLLRRPTTGRNDEEQLLSEILHDTSRVGRLVSDLLQTARLDQGIHLEPAPCDVVTVCRHEGDRIGRLHPTLEVTIGAPGWNGHRPALDARVVHDIVANLLDEARRQAVSRVAVTVARVEDNVDISVAHDGPALPPHLAEAVFERAVGLDRPGGSGLGLPIARELARAHGGDVGYNECALVVSLPWETPPPAQPHRAPRRARPEAAAPVPAQ